MINSISVRADRVIYDKPRQTGPLTQEDIEHRALNREIMKRLDFKAVKSSMAEGRRRFTDSQILSNNKYEGIEVNISEDAQRLYTLMRTEDVEAVATKRYEEFLNLSDQLASANALMSDKSADFLNAAAAYFMGDERASIRDEFFNAYTDTEIYSIYEYAARLYGEIASISSGDANDASNLASVANKYGELVMDIEERYSGEELEKHRAYLSAAFDLTAGIYGKDRARGVQGMLMMGSFRVEWHNKMVQQGQPGLFEGGIIEAENKDFRNMIEKLVAGIKESTNHYAQLAKSFVLENGLISSQQHESDLVAYLMNAERPKGGLSFSELNSINDIFKRNADYNQANEPKDSDKFPHQLPLRKETMFSELKRLLSW